jgi:hypothetical protein
VNTGAALLITHARFSAWLDHCPDPALKMFESPKKNGAAEATLSSRYISAVVLQARGQGTSYTVRRNYLCIRSVLGA